MLADLADLAALGAMPNNWTDTSKEAVRGTRLLAMAQGLALNYIGIDEATVIATWDDDRKMRLTVWIAEKAATRLSVSAAPTVDQYGGMATPMSMKLNRWEKNDLREIAGRLGMVAIGVDTGYGALTGRIGPWFGAGGFMEDDISRLLPE